MRGALDFFGFFGGLPRRRLGRLGAGLQRDQRTLGRLGLLRPREVHRLAGGGVRGLRRLVEAEHPAGREGTEPHHHADDEAHAHEREQAGQDRMLLSIGHVGSPPGTADRRGAGAGAARPLSGTRSTGTNPESGKSTPGARRGPRARTRTRFTLPSTGRLRPRLGTASRVHAAVMTNDPAIILPPRWRCTSDPERGVVVTARQASIPPSGVPPELVLCRTRVDDSLASWRARALAGLAERLDGLRPRGRGRPRARRPRGGVPPVRSPRRARRPGQRPVGLAGGRRRRDADVHGGAGGLRRLLRRLRGGRGDRRPGAGRSAAR